MPDQPSPSPQFLRDGEGDVLQFSPSERLILTYMPGGMKAFFEEASPLMHSTHPDPAALEAVNERHDTRVVGPPLPSPAPPVVV